MTEETQTPAGEVKALHLPSVDEMLAARPQVQEVTVEYPAVGYVFTLRQIIDANAFAEVARKATEMTEIDYTNPITGDKVRLDFSQAYGYARLKETLVDPQQMGDAEKRHPYTVKQLIEVGCIHGAMMVDLLYQSRQLNDIDAQIDAAKNVSPSTSPGA